MWFKTCFFCKNPIEEGEAHVPHYTFSGKHYRHLACKELQPPLDYVPFGNVTDEDLLKEE